MLRAEGLQLIGRQSVSAAPTASHRRLVKENHHPELPIAVDALEGPSPPRAYLQRCTSGRTRGCRRREAAPTAARSPATMRVLIAIILLAPLLMTTSLAGEYCDNFETSGDFGSFWKQVTQDSAGKWEPTSYKEISKTIADFPAPASGDTVLYLTPPQGGSTASARMETIDSFGFPDHSNISFRYWLRSKYTASATLYVKLASNMSEGDTIIDLSPRSSPDNSDWMEASVPIATKDNKKYQVTSNVANRNLILLHIPDHDGAWRHLRSTGEGSNLPTNPALGHRREKRKEPFENCTKTLAKLPRPFSFASGRNCHLHRSEKVKYPSFTVTSRTWKSLFSRQISYAKENKKTKVNEISCHFHQFSSISYSQTCCCGIFLFSFVSGLH